MMTFLRKLGVDDAKREILALRPSSLRHKSGQRYWGLVLQAKGDYKGARDAFTHISPSCRKPMQRIPGGPRRSPPMSLGPISTRATTPPRNRKHAPPWSCAPSWGGKETPEFPLSLKEIAQTRLCWRPPSAKSLLRRALEIRRKRLRARYPDLATTEVRLGEAFPPFAARTNTPSCTATLPRSLYRPRNWIPRSRRSCRAVILKAMAKGPERRFRRAKAFTRAAAAAK
jgi:hypothetical protein